MALVPKNKGDVLAQIAWSCPHCHGQAEIYENVDGAMIRASGDDPLAFVVCELEAALTSLHAAIQRHIDEEHPEMVAANVEA